MKSFPDFFAFLQVIPGVVYVEEHRFQRVRVVLHAVHKVGLQIDSRVLLTNSGISSRNHLNHAARAR